MPRALTAISLYAIVTVGKRKEKNESKKRRRKIWDREIRVVPCVSTASEQKWLFLSFSGCLFFYS